MEGIDSTRTFFSELLQQAGYETGMIGKWHLMCTPKGFDYYHVFWDQGTYYNPQFMGQDTQGKYIREEGYATELITKHAVEFLDNRDTMGKVYYPRLVNPVATALSNLIALGIQLLMFFGFWLFYVLRGGAGIQVTPALLLAPLWSADKKAVLNYVNQYLRGL